MADPTTPGKHWPSNAVLLVLLVLAAVALAIDLWDGHPLKTLSSAGIVVGLGTLLQARRFESSRWRMVAVLAFTLSVAALLVRLALWQGWV
jgi:hypothetical protein